MRLFYWRWLAVVFIVMPSAFGCATGGRSYGDVDVSSGPINRTLGRDALIRKSTEAVAIIETETGRGMGFVIDPAGYLLTNRHVVEDAAHVEYVRFPAQHPPRSYQSVQIIYIDPLLDLALLKVSTEDRLPFIPLAARKSVPTGRYLHPDDPVVLFERDEHAGSGFSSRSGEVRRLAVFNAAAGPNAFVSVSTDFHRGQSGGPLLDRLGRVVGIATWTWRDQVGGYAIPIADATKMLAERPKLDNARRRRSRAEARTRTFLAALGRGDVIGARRLTSPSHARRVRERVVSSIMATMEGEGLPLMQGFVAAVEGVVHERHHLPSQLEALGEIVEQTGTPRFRRALGVHASVNASQVMSFFHELGQAYLTARSIRGEEPSAALQQAMKRLRTVDAARTFALAGVLAQLGGSEIRIESVEIVPGAYGPRAVVTLRSKRLEASAHMTLEMRLEWGDWYIASVRPTPLPSPTPVQASRTGLAPADL